MPLQATSGAASYDAFGGGVPAAPPTYIEDVFSTFLYTGNGSTQTITNGIDLSTKGGLVWLKTRSFAWNNYLFDTARGITNYVSSNQDQPQNWVATVTDAISSATTTGFVLGAGATVNGTNNSGYTFTSWTFREQAKFFDIVTYTGTGSNTTISHSLGSVPACIMVKRTDTTGDWQVYHRSLANTEYLVLNTTAAKATGATRWNSTTPTSSVFSLGTDATVNASGGTYIAYIFAHDAGGFGLTGTDNVISCGSFTTDGSGNATVSLGYEPQWLMIKKSSGAQNWNIFDSMRGMPVGSADSRLFPNSSAAEDTSDDLDINATGFTIKNNAFGASATCIYIAIRRGPMKVPTTGTSVYNAIARTGTGGGPVSSTGVGFPPDFGLTMSRSAIRSHYIEDRLRGALANIDTTATTAENSAIGGYSSFDMDGVTFSGGQASWNNASETYINYFYRRAPSFFDEVCYTGDGVAGRTIEHNLGVVPELMIVKCRTDTDLWPVYSATLGPTKYITLNTGVVTTTSGSWNNTAPTALVFSVGPNSYVNFSSSRTYVAYLFATCAGVSKVGSYTGTGTTLQINCGFTAGARFVLIKRTDATSDWYVWDTARGIIAGNDPYLLLNSTAAEVTSTDYIDTYSAGFEISSTAPAAINANGGSFIFLAIS